MQRVANVIQRELSGNMPIILATRGSGCAGKGHLDKKATKSTSLTAHSSSGVPQKCTLSSLGKEKPYNSHVIHLKEPCGRNVQK